MFNDNILNGIFQFQQARREELANEENPNRDKCKLVKPLIRKPGHFHNKTGNKRKLNNRDKKLIKRNELRFKRKKGF